MTTTEQKGVDCPNCCLSPEQVEPGDHYPIDYGPGLVLCPKCGLVRHSGKTIAEIRSEREGRMARGLFYSETRKGSRRGSSDPVGEAKKARRSDGFRYEQDFAGFPDGDKASRAKSVEPLGSHATIWLTREISDWMRAKAATLSCNDSDLVRTCLSWAFQFRPVPRSAVVTDGKSKWKRISVRLSEAEHSMVLQLAAEANTSPQKYLKLLLDELRRKSSLSDQLRSSRG